MKKPAQLGAIDIAAVQSRMLTIRNQQVLLDRDVAALYGVETKALNQAVKRNAERFEDGYLFQLDAHEVENWKSQIVTSILQYYDVLQDLRSQIATAKNPVPPLSVET